MPNYHPYPEYKDSGIDWLGKIPTHWQVTKLRFLFSLGRGLGITKENLLDEGIPCINYGEIHSKYGFEILPEKHSLKCVASDYLETGAGALLSAGDFVFADTSEDIEGAGNFSHLNSDTPTFAGYHTVIARPISNDIPRYMAYLFDSLPYRYQIRKSVSGIKVFSITHGILKNCYLWIPQKKEQQQIAAFLDRETAKIDQLIAKQQQLIELLKEKRQAVISHAVTKGLNPNVKMKPSGVEWLGDVPEHWEIKRIGLLFSESSSRADSDEEQDFPILRVSIHHGISDKELTEEESDRKLQRSDDKSLYKVVHENYLVYNMMRAWQGGFGAAKISGLVSPAYVICKPKTSIDSSFFELILRTANAITELKRYSKGITDFRLRLYWDEFKDICVPVPPVSEVQLIIKSIEKISDQYNHLIGKAEEQIELLRERRAALISAAVTGKIDVREVALLA